MLPYILVTIVLAITCASFVHLCLRTMYNNDKAISIIKEDIKFMKDELGDIINSTFVINDKITTFINMETTLNSEEIILNWSQIVDNMYSVDYNDICITKDLTCYNDKPSIIKLYVTYDELKLDMDLEFEEVSIESIDKVVVDIIKFASALKIKLKET